MSSSIIQTNDWRARLESLLTNFDINTLLQSRWVQQTPLWLNILMVVLLAYAMAELTWRIITPSSSSLVTSPQNSNTVQQRQSARLNTIGDMHLFGIAQSNNAKPQNIKKTQLNLALHGVFASTDPAQSVAIIAEGKKAKGRAYKIGDSIKGSVVYEVKATEVILKRNGRFESLALPRERLPLGNNRKTKSQRVSTVRNVQSNQRLRNLRNTFVKNPDKFWRNIRIEPAIDNVSGNVKGYTIRHNDQKIMRAMGILPGDVVTSVNGQPLTDPTVAVGLMEQFKSGKEFSLTVERNGQLQTINVKM